MGALDYSEWWWKPLLYRTMGHWWFWKKWWSCCHGMYLSHLRLKQCWAQTTPRFSFLFFIFHFPFSFFCWRKGWGIMRCHATWTRLLILKALRSRWLFRYCSRLIRVCGGRVGHLFWNSIVCFSQKKIPFFSPVWCYIQHTRARYLWWLVH